METTLSGREGERAAARHLEKKGYKILESNYRAGGAEVDIIAEKDQTLIFVEVKARGTDKYGLPEEFVDARKRRKIIRAAKIFSGNTYYENYFIRFDIIAVQFSEGEFNINHIQDAFEES